MNLKPSTALRNDYPQVAALAKESGQPIVITNKGEADLVVMSVDAYERRERAEFSRLSGAPTLSIEEVRARLEEKYTHGQV